MNFQIIDFISMNHFGQIMCMYSGSLKTAQKCQTFVTFADKCVVIGKSTVQMCLIFMVLQYLNRAP